MPNYDFKCSNEECLHEMEDLFLSFEADLDQIKCEVCGSKADNMSFGGIGTIFKGFVWQTKKEKVNNERETKSKKLDKKQREEHAQMQLVPNIAGEEVDSWSDARKLASEAGLDTTNYEKLEEKDKKLGRYERPN